MIKKWSKSGVSYEFPKISRHYGTCSKVQTGVKIFENFKKHLVSAMSMSPLIFFCTCEYLCQIETLCKYTSADDKEDRMCHSHEKTTAKNLATLPSVFS